MVLQPVVQAYHYRAYEIWKSIGLFIDSNKIDILFRISTLFQIKSRFILQI